jgi:hypothetical protein
MLALCRLPHIESDLATALTSLGDQTASKPFLRRPYNAVTDGPTILLAPFLARTSSIASLNP